MINAIRQVRRAKGMTLDDVARRCQPPTTAQTIGRLETGTRTLSLDWLNRIAAALDVEPSDLVRTTDESPVMIAALLGPDGAHAPTQPMEAMTARAAEGMVAVHVTASIGEYRVGDDIWCRPLDDNWSAALNRDVLVPRPGGRFFFARLLNVEDGRLHLLPFGAGQRQQVVNAPPWVAVAVRLIRTL